MKNPLSYIGSIFDPQSAIDEGWAYKHKPPTLSPEKKKQLMEASAMESPRGVLRTAGAVLMPYITKSSLQEKAKAATLLAISLGMTWYAVQITVEFGHWQSGLTNTVQQLFQEMMSSRPDMMADLLGNLPALQDVLTENELLKEMLLKYPDTTSILYDPRFAEIVQQNPGFQELLQKNPTIQDVFMAFPGIKEQVSANPAILDQLNNLQNGLSESLFAKPTIQEHLKTLWALSGGDFLTKWGSALTTTFNSVASSVTNGDISNVVSGKVGEAWKNAWYSKDLATIALKFTAMAIASYKASQYLALRWRAWTTGYYTNKWTSAKAYSRLKSTFNNVDNPPQRLQEDPAKFTAGAVSLMTGVMNSGMQLASFSGMLWGMGSFYGVPGGMFWIGAGYAGVLTALTFGAGRKLPWIQRQQQRREGDFRASLEKMHNNADLIAQNSSEEIENDLIKKRFRPVMTNSVREIGTQVKLIVVDATAGNLSIPIPWVAGAFAVAAGTASMGTIQTINYAFNRVTSAMSFLVNRFEQLSQMKATADRICQFDQAIEASHYIEEEKRQESQKRADATPPSKPNAP